MATRSTPWLRPAAWSGVALILTVGVAAAYQGGRWHVPAEAKATTSPYEFGHADMHRAHVVFETHCVSCHGADLTSRTPTGRSLDPPPPDLLVSGRMDGVGELEWKIRTGRNAMPGFADALSEREIWLMAAFIVHVADHHGGSGTDDKGGHGAGHHSGSKID